MNTIFETFRKKFWGRILTVAELGLPDPKQREAFLSLVRQEMNRSLEELERDLMGGDAEEA